MIINCSKCNREYKVLDMEEEFVGKHNYAYFSPTLYDDEKKYLGIKCPKCGRFNIKHIE